MATRTISAVGGNWNAVTAWVEGAVPTAADDVVATAVSAALTVTAGSVCRSMILTGYTSTISGSGDVSIGNASGGACTLAGTIAGTWLTSFVSTSNNGGTGWNVTSNGKTFPGTVTFGGAGGKWRLTDAFVSGNNILLTVGTLDTNDQNVTCFTFNTSNTGVRTLTLGTTNLLVKDTITTAFTAVTATNLTVTANTATITANGAGGGIAIQGSASTWNTAGTSFVMSGTGTQLFTGSGSTITNLTRTGTAARTDGINFNGGVTITGTLTLNGNSAVNRLLVSSTTVGVNRTLTAATLAVSNADFQDVTGAGAASWNLASITGNSGDAGGNSGITFTTPATQTWVGTSGGNWFDPTKWTSRVPLPQDNVLIASAFTAAQTIAMNMPRLGANIDFTGTTGNPILQPSADNPAIYGSFTLVSGMTSSTGGGPYTFAGRGTHTITSAGMQLRNSVAFSGAVGGTYSLQDAFYTTSSFTVSDGTFNSNNFSLTSGAQFISNTVRARSINLGTSIVTLPTLVSPLATFGATNLTASMASSTFVFTGVTTTDRTFTGGGQSFGTLTYTVAGSVGGLIIAGANTFDTLNVGSGRSLTLPSGSTTTVTNPNINGTMNGYLYVPGTGTDNASAPDSAALDLVGDLTIDAYIAPDTWTPAATAFAVSKGSAGNTGGAYSFGLNTAGTLRLHLSDGTSSFTFSSTVAVGLGAGVATWVRVSLDLDNGAGGATARFYTSPDGVTWTILGAAVTVAGTLTILANSTALRIGATGSQASPLAGKYLRVKIYNSDLQTTAGTPVFDADFTAKLIGANTFTESSSNAATVTINGAAAQAGDGRIAITASTPGSAATLSFAGPQILRSDFVTVQDITATGGAAGYFAYNHTSADLGGNTGWTFGTVFTPVAAGGNWSATGTWMGATVPTAASRVILTSTAGNLVINAASACRSFDASYGYTGTVSGTSTLSIGDASGGSCTLGFGMTLTGTWTVSFVATTTNGGVGWAVTSNGKAFPNTSVTFNGAGGKWVLADAFVGGNSLQINATGGILDTNSQNVTCQVFNSSSGSTRTLTLGSSAITVTGSNGVVWMTTTTTNLTISPNTAVVTFTGTGAQMSLGIGVTNYQGLSLVFSGSGAAAITNANTTVTFGNVTRIGTATKNDSLLLTPSVICTGTLTLTSNSVINRMLVSSATPGVTATITAAAVSLSNVDFMDIAGAGAAAPFTGTSMGDAQGNSGITFDAPVTQTHTASVGGNWSDVTKWTSRIPLPQDDVIVNANTTGGLATDMTRLGKNIDFTGFAGSLTGGGAGTSSYGNWAFSTGMTSNANSHNFLGRGSHTITSNGKFFAIGLAIVSPGGTYALQDAFGSGGVFTVTDGTFTTNNYSMTVLQFVSNNTRVRIMNMGTSVVSLTGTTALTIVACSTGAGVATWDASGATFVITNASTATRTVSGVGAGTGSSPFGTVTYTVANSPGTLALVGGNSTFTTLSVGSGRSVTVVSTGTIFVTNLNLAGANNGYQRLQGSGSPVSTPDSVALSPTGDITIDVKVALDNWNPGVNQKLVTKSGSGQVSYQLFVGSTGSLIGSVTTDGFTQLTGTSTVATGLSAGAVKWLRFSFKANNGSSQRVYRFYVSDDGVTWTQLGSTITVAGAVTVFDGTAPLEIGSDFNGATSTAAVGNFYNAKVYASDLGSGAGTPVFNADFTAKPVGANTFTESSVNAATVTINGALNQVGDGRVALSSSIPGSAATILKASGVVEAPFMAIQDSIATGGATFYAPSSVNNGNNTGWTFSLAPMTVGDLLGLSDVGDPALTMNIPQNELLGLSDIADASRAFNAAPNDLLGLVDSSSPSLVRAVSIGDLLGLIDATSFVININLLPADSLGIVDATKFTYNLNLNELLGLIDVAFPLGIKPVTVSDLLGMSDTTVVKVLLIPTALGLDIWIEEPISIKLTIEEGASIQ